MSQSRYVHYLPAGGLGDVFRETYYHNALGILKRFKQEQPDSYLKLVCMTHNPAVGDIFEGQTWIDEVALVAFQAEDVGNWPAVYKDYPAEFEGFTELRFNIPDHRSNYRSDLMIHRPRLPEMKTITPVGIPWEPALTPDEWLQVEANAGAVLFHPYAGDFHRTIAEDIQDWLQDTYDPTKTWVKIGAQYDRNGHTEEDGQTFEPRVLFEIVRRAKAIIATESSVYYLGSMLGIPTMMFYRDGHAFSRWIHNNDATWDWFFNTKDPHSQFVRMPVDDTQRVRIDNWMKRYAAA